MAILSKGATIVADTQVSATNLNNLVDAATFVSGAVDGTTTQLSSGAIIVKDGGITPAKISTGGPSWTSGGTVSATAFSGPLTGAVTGNVTGNVNGNSSTATAFATARTISITGDLAYTSPSFDGTGNVTAAGTLATVASAGTTGGSTAIPVVTINAKGLTTSITTAAVIAPAGTLSGATLASGVTASSLTSVGTLGSLTVTNPITGSITGSSGSTTGNAATATKIASITNSDIVQLTASQTLTNKTLTAPTITGAGAIAGSFTGPLTGNVIASVASITLLSLVPDFGYPTSGTITLNLAAASNAKIELAGNSTFALSGIASGQVNIVALKNNTGGTINTTWPAWTSAGGSFPASLTSGQAMVVSLYSYGSTTASVYAVSSI